MLKKLLGHSFFYKVSSNSYFSTTFGFLVFIFYLLQFFSGFFISINLLDLSYFFKLFHRTCSYFILFFVFAHIFKNLFYRSYLYSTNSVLFFSGWVSLFVLFFTCFTGYLIPWGQVSF